MQYFTEIITISVRKSIILDLTVFFAKKSLKTAFNFKSTPATILNFGWILWYYEAKIDFRRKTRFHVDLVVLYSFNYKTILHNIIHT